MTGTTESARIGNRAGTPGTVRRFGEEHPEWWAMLAAAGAWGVLVVLPHSPAAHHAHHGHAPSAGFGALATAVMVIAMMLPLAIPSIRHAALYSPGRRHRATGGFLAGYLAVWMLAMLVIGAAWTVGASLAGWTAAAAGTVAVAALWQTTAVRGRFVRWCGHTPPLPQRGWRADVSCARYGAASGIACVGTCWALMAVCVAFAHSLPVMVVLFGVQLAERYGQRHAPGLAAAAVLGIGLAAVAARMAV